MTHEFQPLYRNSRQSSSTKRRPEVRMMLAFAVGSSAARRTPAGGVDAVTSVAGAPAAAGAAVSMAVGAAVGRSVGTEVGAAVGARVPGSGVVGAGANSARRRTTL